MLLFANCNQGEIISYRTKKDDTNTHRYFLLRAHIASFHSTTFILPLSDRLYPLEGPPSRSQLTWNMTECKKKCKKSARKRKKKKDFAKLSIPNTSSIQISSQWHLFSPNMLKQFYRYKYYI